LVTEPAEVTRAQEQLLAGAPTDYVIMRVSEGGYSNENRAWQLRSLLEREHFITRPPEPGEYEAIEVGRQALRNPADHAMTVPARRGWLPRIRRSRRPIPG
jgi:hypothetical protein